MKDATERQETIAIWMLFGIGALLLAIAFYFDPIGTSPDSGVLDLGSVGTKRLLGCAGGFCILGGVWSLLKKLKLRK